MMTINNLLALDIGKKRIGVARANMIARLPQPLITLDNNDQLINKLSELINLYDIDIIIVGLPRSLDGNETEQSKYTRDFTKDIAVFNIPVVFQDETLTSVNAKNRLNNKSYKSVSIDAEAAAIILEDYIISQRKNEIHA